ncbi:uncharacterized protein LOC112467611 [Temnothorax curvispinosus]|uniref:Uncharacterized protein LOC112467611 n=1 Tax=Temnothorax curvispinosus TaxID=300111 RepID=A0A6J1RCS5_9HYME|nr:uncharacterized protein LOC112467611 [Temnothorax curvispinosus]
MYIYPIFCPNFPNPSLGHWTLRGRKDPDNVITDLNSCLFSVIGFQIGQDPLKLRKWTVLQLKNNFQNLAKWINKVKLERNDKMILMIGGARYRGTEPAHAKAILDRSENRESNYYKKGYPVKGHARGHSMKIYSEDDPYQTVEQYARQYSKDKAGFLSRADQDFVADLALRTEEAQLAMRRLNDRINPTPIEEIRISANALRNICSERPLPQIKVWDKNGNEYPRSLQDLETVKLVITHQHNMSDMTDEDVFVITFYPVVNARYRY